MSDTLQHFEPSYSHRFTLYEDDELTFELEHYDGRPEGNPYCVFLHFDIRDVRLSVVKRMKSKMEELRSQLISMGYDEVHGYSQNADMARLFPNTELLEHFYVEDERYYLYECQLQQLSQ